MLLFVLRENMPVSMAAIARIMASLADVESVSVTKTCNLAGCVAINGFPLLRLTLARHRPGSRSNASIVNRLYSI